MKSFPHKKRKEDNPNGRITIRQFQRMSKDWGLNEGFVNQFEKAIKDNLDSKVITRVTDLEKRWMCVYGFDFNRSGDGYEVEI